MGHNLLRRGVFFRAERSQKTPKPGKKLLKYPKRLDLSRVLFLVFSVITIACALTSPPSPNISKAHTWLLPIGRGPIVESILFTYNSPRFICCNTLFNNPVETKQLTDNLFCATASNTCRITHLTPKAFTSGDSFSRHPCGCMLGLRGWLS